MIPLITAAAVRGAQTPGPTLADPAAPAASALPAWTSEKPHFFDRGGRRFASAVGRARAGDAALARATAEDRARVELLGFLKGSTPGRYFEGVLSGAYMTDAFAAKDGAEVFVRVEIAAPPER
ncbi:MAG: hypothetical protein ACHQ49_07580 [Elusimicrobiota bacterium]